MTQNRIDLTWKELKRKQRKAFVAFLTAGDPDVSTSLQHMVELCKSGVDILEIGMPFSDPVADGPVIQLANQRALESGTNLKKVLKLVADLRKQVETPIVLMGYFNPILQYGVEKFADDFQSAGGDGLLIVDLPAEESEEFRFVWKKYNLHAIHLIAPTTAQERMSGILKASSGYIYCVSLEGTTGSKLDNLKKVGSWVDQIRSNSKVPVVLGFGIHSKDQVKQLRDHVDGVVIGSALIQMIHQNPKQGIEKAKRLVQEISREL